MHYDDELFDEEKEISIDELVEALSGEDEDGDPKSVVECSLYKVETTEDGTLEKINEMTSFTAAPGVFVNRISFTGPFVMVELGIAIKSDTKIIIGINSDIRLQSA